MAEIKAIETVYNGYRFRSRLEARWAVFLDAMGIKYLYEPEGYKLSDGTYYLPDFYLPEMDEFLEVKGALKLTDRHKVLQFIKEYKRPVVIGYDNIEFKACSDYSSIQAGEEFIQDTKEQSYIMKCNKCGKYYFSGSSGSWHCQCCGYYDGDNTSEWCGIGSGDTGYLLESNEKEKFINAVKKAKQARFEYGECGM